MSFKLGDQELALLFSSEVSHGARSLYLFLRSRMDYATGLVGEKTVLSYQAISEHLEYVPPRGSKLSRLQPGRDWIRARFDELERAGGLSRVTSQRGRKMVVRLPLASIRPQEEPHYDPHLEPHYEPQPKARNGAASRHMSPIRSPISSEARNPIHPEYINTPSLRDETPSGVDDDPKAIVFGKGLDWLMKHTGKSEQSLRATLGRFCRDFGDAAVLAVMRDAQAAKPVDPIAWIRKALKTRADRAASPTALALSGQVNSQTFSPDDIPDDIAAEAELIMQETCRG